MYVTGSFSPTIVHSLVVAKFAEDNNWYRAEVLKVGGNLITVLFIDYGNTAEVPVTSVAQIHPSLLDIPRCGIRYGL